MPLFDKTIDVLDKSLDLYLLRQQVISDNIANAETPYFKARRVDFESELQRAVEESETGAGRDISSVGPRIYEDPYSETGQDLNTVDMDREMAEMSKNDVKYSATTQAITKKFALLKYAISEGGKE
jgi:flagellar basal-body rod protein FlgB